MKTRVSFRRGSLSGGPSISLLTVGIAVCLAFAAAPPARAIVANYVSDYEFTGNSLASSDTDANSTSSGITTGAAFSGSAQFLTIFGNTAYGVFSNLTPATEALAISGSAYFSFTFTPVNGSYVFNQVRTNFDASPNGLPSSSSTYTAAISIRWSVDNFATTLSTGSTTVNNGQTGGSGVTADLSSFPAQSGPVEFRFYVFDDQNESQFTNVALDGVTLTGTFTPAPVYKPDARLGLNAAVAVGDNIYNLTAAGQTLNALVRHGGGVKTVVVGIQNDGNQADSFTVYGAPGNVKFAVQYFNGATNVTYAVTHGTFNTGSLPPGTLLLLRARITARTPLAGQLRSLPIVATSTTDGTKKDMALIKARSN